MVAKTRALNYEIEITSENSGNLTPFTLWPFHLHLRSAVTFYLHLHLHLHLLTFSPSPSFCPSLPRQAQDREDDRMMKRRIAALNTFIAPRHLDIEATDASLKPSWDMAQNELQKIDTYKAPRDKMVCVLNCCNVLQVRIDKRAIAVHYISIDYHVTDFFEGVATY